MGVGSPGQEQFRDAIVEFRNVHIVAGIAPVITLRQEVLGNDELSNRTGMDTVTKNHLVSLLQNCDKMRRRVTYNPNNEPIGDQIAKAIDPNASMDEGATPFATDNVQAASAGLVQLPFALDGTDENIPLRSKIKTTSANALLLLGAIDGTIVAWTRLQSNSRSRMITVYDSMRIYQLYQEILGYLNAFAGDENMVDVAQVLPTAEPRGPQNSPNRIGESSGLPAA